MTQIHTPFPFDVWQEVLCHLATSFASPYKLDEVDTLPLQRRILSWETGRPFTKQWLDLRLVCREWAEWMWIPFKSFHEWDYDGEPTNRPITWIHINATDATLTRLHHFIRPTEAASRVVTLSISAQSITCFNIALELGKRLPNVRNLSLGIDCTVPDFWRRLRTAFPNIIVLRLRGIKTDWNNTDDDCTSLYNLQYLEMDDVSHRGILEDFEFPSLRHLVVKGHMRDGTIVKDHAQQLEYASFNSSCCITALAWLPDCFWTAMPRLQVIELPPFQVDRSPPPPPGHSLRYLVLQRLWGEECHNVTALMYIGEILYRYPGIQKFSITTRGWTFWEKLWLQLMCRRHNLVLVPLLVAPDPMKPSVIGIFTHQVTRTLSFVFHALLLGVISGLRWGTTRPRTQGSDGNE